VIFVETDDPYGPYGAKGLGEIPIVPVPGALANSIYQATGVRFRELPITPDKILDALRRSETASRI
jgi:xanthine dehydrogenase molybdenum-binding subunit